MKTSCHGGIAVGALLPDRFFNNADTALWRDRHASISPHTAAAYRTERTGGLTLIVNVHGGESIRLFRLGNKSW